MIAANLTALIALALVIFVIGFTLGWLVGLPKPSGSFQINHSDPTKDLCTLELEQDLDKIEAKKTMTLRVRVIKEDTKL